MSTTQPEALRENYTAADMATAAAQGFRDGVASVAASAGSEPVLTDMVAVCREDANRYCIILRLLGMEEEGDPVAEVQRLQDLAANLQGKQHGWLYDWTHSSATGRPDESFTGFTEDENHARSGTGHRNIRAVYTSPSPPEGAGWRQGVEAAAALLSKKADDFAQQHGYDDMGSLSFGRSAHADAKLDYHSGLLELAEEVRAMNEHAVHPANDGTHVLMEHSGCGRGTQVDTLMVRLNPGDKVIFHQGPITRAMLKAAPLPPAPSTEGESNV